MWTLTLINLQNRHELKVHVMNKPQVDVGLVSRSITWCIFAEKQMEVIYLMKQLLLWF